MALGKKLLPAEHQAVTGVVLAGGKATRMPNKLYLSTKTHQPLLGHAVEYLVQQGITNILISVNEQDRDQVMGFISHQNYKVHLGCVIDKQEGVVAALNCVANSPPVDDASVFKLMVVCCDNVYPMKERLIPSVYADNCSYAVTRPIVPGRHINGEHLTQLDCWNSETGWTPRSERAIYLENALTTPWLLDATALRQELIHEEHLKSGSLMDLFNAMDVQPWKQDPEGWADLGTKEVYAKYWKEDP